MRSIPFRTLTENEWLFPTDTVGTPENEITLDAARGGNVLFQILTDEVLAAPAPFTMTLAGANGVTVTPYRLAAVNVPKNSGPRGQASLAKSYEDVADFVTKKAPFDVYDITEEIGDTLAEGKLAYAVRIEVAPNAPVGAESILIVLSAGDAAVTVKVTLNIHKAVIPALRDSRLIVCNWIYPDHIVAGHGVEAYSEEYYAILRKYMLHLVDIRSNHFSMMGSNMLVGGFPIRDEGGRIVDFDFSVFERHLKMADEVGFTALYGPYLAHWGTPSDDNLYLLWDREVAVTEREGYRQLSIYLKRLREMIERNGWEKKYIQPLVDEPQVPNERPYRILAAIFRRFMPGYLVHDPLETTDVGGGPDIWCIKQAVFEKYIDIYREYQAMGEKFTFYTCGHPMGDHINRVLDLPLVVGRLGFWMCYRYGLLGFLHWGYHAYADRKKTLCVGPAGNQCIVYPDGDGLVDTVRSHGQRAGAEDWELFAMLYRLDAARADALLARGCRTFTDYERSGTEVDRIHRDLLLALDEYL